MTKTVNRRIAAAIMATFVTIGLMTPGQSQAQTSLEEAVSLAESGRYEDARAAFMELAEAGEPEAMYHLGAMLHGGAGGEENLDQAVQWYRKASDGGSMEAKFALGALYYKGKGVPEDLARALELFTDAANGGVLAAQYNLAMMHASGLAHSVEYGAQEDRPRAFKWFAIVLSQLEDPESRSVVEENFAFLKKQMYPDEITKGQAMADEWMAVRSEKGGAQ